MKVNYYTVHKNEDGDWYVTSSGNPKKTHKFGTKKQAVEAARKFAQQGKTVIVYNENGNVNQVLGLKYKPAMKAVKTRSKLKTKDVNIAIAKAMETNVVKG
ncbi:hypothetical protein C7I36_03615 [Zobellella taiwanensis]|uniref:DUF2188 domain-containing protein n=1 Tax=Zobellella taiwanensis TaxID=347535 RepID=A0A2P7R9V2_9GAMM|nr:DUF2188 domain-containing protein [Zobellella taiwanensis]PSJ46996.1 hypothetical protein C7I36_03615 [Zobellella taiwanensis]